MTMRKITARILEVTKDDQRICSARLIWAKLEDEKSKDVYQVSWAEMPTVIGPTGVWTSRARYAFTKAWDKCKVGDEVWLYHAEDRNLNFFEPKE